MFYGHNPFSLCLSTVYNSRVVSVSSAAMDPYSNSDWSLIGDEVESVPCAAVDPYSELE